MNTLKKGARKNGTQPARAPGGSEEKFTPEQVVKAIRDANGILAGAAKILGCSRTTIYSYAERHPEVKEAIEDQNEVTKDFVEGKLIDAIRNGNITAIIFYLKTKAKDRGYIERTEHSGPDGTPLVPQRANLEGLNDRELEALEKAAAVVDAAFRK